MSDIVVCIYQRGGADALNCVVPYTEGPYFDSRPGLAIPAPGEPGGALPLDNFFGLNPDARALQPLFDAGRLAAVHATSVPHRQRSHFAAQALAERGVTEPGITDTGWLGRYLASSASSADRLLRAVSIGPSVPALLRGGQTPLALKSIGDFSLGDQADDDYKRLLSTLFQQSPALIGAADTLLGGIEELATANLARFRPDNGARYAETPVGSALQTAAQLIKADLGIELICLDSPEWDHHATQAPKLTAQLTDLATSLAAFNTDMGQRMNNITVFVQTEFGRSLRVNSSAGTDHGTGGVAWVLGGGVNGGQVMADWPGLAPNQLFEERDLAITIDLRDVIAQLIERRMRAADLSDVFPGYVPRTLPDLFLS